MATFIEAIKTDDLNLEISIEGHLPINGLAEGGFASSRSSSNSNKDPLRRDLVLAHFSLEHG